MSLNSVLNYFKAYLGLIRLAVRLICFQSSLFKIYETDLEVRQRDVANDAYLLSTTVKVMSTILPLATKLSKK